MEVAEFIKSITREKNLSRIGEPSDDFLTKAFDKLDKATKKMLVMDYDALENPGKVYEEAKETEGSFVYHEIDNSIMFYDKELEDYTNTLTVYNYALREELLIAWVIKKFDMSVMPNACYFPKKVSERQYNAR